VGYDPEPELRAIQESTLRFLRSLRGLGEHQLSAPSRCEGWTRSHVVNHVARNADALRRLFAGATSGLPTPMYESAQARTEGIEAGVGRDVATLLDDVATSATWLAEAMRDLPPAGWDARVRMGVAGQGPEVVVSELPFRRLIELEVHHVDLDLTYTPAHWPDGLVTRLLDLTATRFAGRDDVPPVELLATDTGRSWRWGGTGPLVHGPERALLGWTLGRTDGDGLTAEPAGLPVLPAWG
jgi:maleylpyruvate isomerase